MSVKNIKLEKPLFYANEFALRFEIGPKEEKIWDEEQGCFNESYFSIALERALKVFNTVFEDDDDVLVAYQIFSDGRRKIKRQNFLFKQIRRLADKPITFTKHRDIYSEELDYKCEYWHRAVISGLKKSDINTTQVFKSLIDSDFGSRGSYLKGEVYVINESKSIVLNLYDDRGMDVISTSKSNLMRLYEEQNTILLDYDRERMDATFACVND